jgi:hypothetical protein
LPYSRAFDVPRLRGLALAEMRDPNVGTITASR